MADSLSKNTLAVVITYNPDIVLLEKNLRALFRQFKNIIIVDNHSQNSNDIVATSKNISNTIILKTLSRNLGIATAQNVGFEMAKEERYKWLLTMDQDSVIPENFTSEYEKIISDYDRIGIIGWSQSGKRTGVRKSLDIISSGSLISVNGLRQIGGFDDDLFIYHVDTDVNLKLSKLKLLTLIAGNVFLEHTDGVKTEHKTITGRSYLTKSPTSQFYLIRNTIIILKRYFFYRPIFVMRMLQGIIIIGGWYYLRYSENKRQAALLLAKAILAGMRNKVGRIE